MNNIEKGNAEPFQGWSNQNDINQDQLILTNIIKRKSTMNNLPPLHDLKIRKSSHQQIQSQLKLEPVRLKNLIKKQQNPKQIRQKTEGFSQVYGDAISPLKKKLIEILNEEQKTKNTPELIIQQSAQQNRSQFTFRKSQENQQQSYYLKYKLNQKSKDLKATGTFQKGKDHQDFQNGMKKTQSKMYMKLNALQIVNDFKQNIYKESASIHNLTSKNRLAQQNVYKHKTKTHKNILVKKPQVYQKLEKVNEKLKQTFFKFDVFEKQKKKKQKLQKLDLLAEFNDQLIFSNSPNKIVEKSLTRRISPLKTIEKDVTSRQDLSIPIKICKQKSPHRYKLTIN